MESHGKYLKLDDAELRTVVRKSYPDVRVRCTTVSNLRWIILQAIYLAWRELKIKQILHRNKRFTRPLCSACVSSAFTGIRWQQAMSIFSIFLSALCICFFFQEAPIGIVREPISINAVLNPRRHHWSRRRLLCCDKMCINSPLQMDRLDNESMNIPLR